MSLAKYCEEGKVGNYYHFTDEEAEFNDLSFIIRQIYQSVVLNMVMGSFGIRNSWICFLTPPEFPRLFKKPLSRSLEGANEIHDGSI